MKTSLKSALAVGAAAAVLAGCASDYGYYDQPYAYDGYGRPYYSEPAYYGPPAVSLGFGYSNYHGHHWH